MPYVWASRWRSVKIFRYIDRITLLHTVLRSCYYIFNVGFCFFCAFYCWCFCSVIDVGSEWRTFSNEKDTKDNSRVGAAEVLSQCDIGCCWYRCSCCCFRFLCLDVRTNLKLACKMFMFLLLFNTAVYLILTSIRIHCWAEVTCQQALLWALGTPVLTRTASRCIGSGDRCKVILLFKKNNRSVNTV